MNEIVVVLYSKYGRLGASSRLRMLQYLPELARNGISVKIQPLFPDNYVRAIYGARPSLGKWSAGAYYPKRFLQLVRNKRLPHLSWIEGELLPYVPHFMERMFVRRNHRYVVDYDDAIFHRYDCSRSAIVRKFLGCKIDLIMRNANCVVAGNCYLAQRAWNAGASRVDIVPTVVDPMQYGSVEHKATQRLTIGWIGSPATEGYLLDVAPALVDACVRYGARLLFVGARAEIVAKFGGVEVEVAAWSESREGFFLAQMDVGIMPLPDTPWERGKCGYKLVQYMASSIPFIASPVGVNVKLAADGRGLLAATLDDWRGSLDVLLGDPQIRMRMGRAGRDTVCREYNIRVQAPRLASILRAAAEE